jgi:dihydrodiol dehydrogenase / D-xylose 1-dehydrogenase (NADP)
MVDFGLDMPLDMQPPGSRIADVKLGAGALLDIGIYPLTWAAMILSSAPENGAEEPDVTSSLTLDLKTGADSICSIILSYHKLSAQAICTASYNCKSPSEFARIEGTEGTIIIEGPAASKPLALIVRQKGKDEERIEFPVRGWGFFYEADAVAKDIRAGRKQNPIMPWSETVRMMRLMDGVRKTAGLTYPQDGGEC